MLGITLSTSSPAKPFWDHVDEASALEDLPSIRALGYRPHLTLTRHMAIELAVLQRAMAVFDGETAISLSFERIDLFDTDPLVLWLAPRRDQRLLDLHSRLHAVLDLDAPSCDPNYAPEHWKPHLTIAMAIPALKRRQALELVSRPLGAFELTFDSVDCASWPPVQVLRRIAMADRAAEPAVDATNSQ